MNINTVFEVLNERYDYSETYIGTCNDSELKDCITKEAKDLPVVTVPFEEYSNEIYIHKYLSIKDNPRYVLVITKEINNDKITV